MAKFKDTEINGSLSVKKDTKEIININYDRITINDIKNDDDYQIIINNSVNINGHAGDTDGNALHIQDGYVQIDNASSPIDNTGRLNPVTSALYIPDGGIYAGGKNCFNGMVRINTYDGNNDTLSALHIPNGGIVTKTLKITSNGFDAVNVPNGGINAENLIINSAAQVSSASISNADASGLSANNISTGLAVSGSGFIIISIDNPIGSDENGTNEYTNLVRKYEIYAYSSYSKNTYTASYIDYKKIQSSDSGSFVESMSLSYNNILSIKFKGFTDASLSYENHQEIIVPSSSIKNAKILVINTKGF